MIDRNFPKDPNFYSQFGFPYGIRLIYIFIDTKK